MPPIDPSRIGPPMGAPSPMNTGATLLPSMPRPDRAALEGQRIDISRQTLGHNISDDMARLKIAQDKADLDRKEEARKQREFELKMEKAAQKQALREPMDEMLGVIDAAANAHKLTRKGGTAGNAWGRTLGAMVPGTSARDLSGYVDTIGANTAFEKLQQLRQESPTGGAVGNVSDTDMKLLKSTIASLDPGQSSEKFQKSMQHVLRTYQKVLYKLPGGKEVYHNWRLKWLGYDPEKRKQGAAPSEDVNAILQKYGVK